MDSHMGISVDTTGLYVLHSKYLREQCDLKEDACCAPTSILCLSSKLLVPVVLMAGNSDLCFS